MKRSQLTRGFIQAFAFGDWEEPHASALAPLRPDAALRNL
jgi:hypothetical protein